MLHACRAWRFAAEGALVSKIDGGRWALHRLPAMGHERGRVRAAELLGHHEVPRFRKSAFFHVSDRSPMVSQ
ncbi:aminoglycoside adenylyltransferase domain-containing protein [[Actinomadura] parvosata]|uniref:aminoglycoside adenylyltransferase domain-containing protein n=1 Tax=[Actinomadura] parvosata TaxID=1955412 RepID=UPI0009ABF3A4